MILLQNASKYLLGAKPPLPVRSLKGDAVGVPHREPGE